MLINDILNEAIDTNEMRKQFTDTLVSNKEALQKVKTTIGMTIALKKLFPGVIFKFFSGNGQRGEFKFDDETVIVNNADKIMSPKTVRNNWNYFVEQIVDTLTHEHIHKEQGTRGASKYHQMVNARKPAQDQVKAAAAFSKQLEELRDLYREATERGFDEQAELTQKKIRRVLSKATQSGFRLEGTYKDYLSNPVEITAFAEEIANNLVKTYKNRQDALNALKSGSDTSDSFKKYTSAFGSGDNTMKRLMKRIAYYIEQKTS